VNIALLELLPLALGESWSKAGRARLFSPMGQGRGAPRDASWRPWRIRNGLDPRPSVSPRCQGTGSAYPLQAVRASQFYRASSGTKAAALIFASARRNSSLPISHFLFYLPAMTPPSKHDRPPDKDGEEDLVRPVHRQRTSTPDVDAVPVDGPVVVLSDQVEERGRRHDSWDRVKRRLRSAFDLLRDLFYVQVQDERV